MEVPEPSFGKVPSVQERASTMPGTRSGVEPDSASSGVTLRVLAAPQDPNKRKSGELM